MCGWVVVRRQAAQLPTLWSSESLLLSSRPASSPMLPHADTHSRIEHFASRYHHIWGRGIVRSPRGRGFQLGQENGTTARGMGTVRICSSQQGPMFGGGGVGTALPNSLIILLCD